MEEDAAKRARDLILYVSGYSTIEYSMQDLPFTYYLLTIRVTDHLSQYKRNSWHHASFFLLFALYIEIISNAYHEPD